MSLSRFVSRYFDLLAEPMFVAAPDGGETFYPLGSFARGYIVPDAETGARLRHHVKWSYALMFVAIGLMAGVLGPAASQGVATLFVAGIAVPALFIRFRWLARDLKPSDVRLTFGDARRLAMSKLDARTLRLLAILAAIMTALSAWGAIVETDGIMRAVLTFGVMLFAYSFVTTTAVAIRRLHNK